MGADTTLETIRKGQVQAIKLLHIPLSMDTLKSYLYWRIDSIQ